MSGTHPVPEPSWWETALDWYWNDFLKGVCFHPFLVLLLVVLVVLPFNVFGEEFGVVQAIWPEGFPRFLVGASFAVVALQALYVSYLLWTRARREGRLGSDRSVLRFGPFALSAAGCLLASLGVLFLLWELVLWLGGWLSASDPGDGDPRFVWLKTAVPEPTTSWPLVVWRLALLPLGGAAVGAVLVLAGRMSLGERLAGWKPFTRVRTALESMQQNLLGHDRPGRARWRTVGVVAVVAAWVLAAGAGLRHDRTYGVVGFAAVGLALFALALWCDHRVSGGGGGARERWSDLTFRACLLTHFVLAYIWATFGMSTYGWEYGLLLVWPVMPVAAVGVLSLALPGPASRWLHRRIELADSDVPKTPDGSASAGALPEARQLWPFVLLAGFAYLLLCNSLAASPASVVCFGLFVLVTGYGLASVVIRRAVPIALAALVFFAVLAGIQPYKFRYDGYQTRDGPVEELEYTDQELLNLQTSAAGDSDRQKCFDQALVDYALLYFAYQTAFQESANAEVNEDEVGKKRAQDKLEAAQKSARAGEGTVRARWADLETKNRLVAGRLVSGNYATPALLKHLDLERTPGPLIRPRDWNLTPDQQKQPIVVIAVSGGGLRSAAWTFTVLRTLEERFAAVGVDFPAQMRVITGASGGMLGAAFYVATLKEKRGAVLDRAIKEKRPDDLAGNNDRLFDQLTQDFLTPLVKQQVYGDLPNFFSPWPARNDRGKALQSEWSDKLGGVLDRTFADLRADERAGQLPSLVFAPMLVEDGRRLIVSNLDMRNPLTNDGPLLRDVDLSATPQTIADTECYSREAVELFRMFPQARDRLRLGTAVRMSASFPFFSTAAALPTVPRRRVVDAGYYDNYGVSLLANWLTSTNNRKWVEKNASRILFIQIRDGTDEQRRRLETIAPDESSGVSRCFEEFTTPLVGLYNARVGSSSFRNDGQLETLQLLLRGGSEPHQIYNRAILPKQRYFQVVTFEFPDRAALSWTLSRVEKDRIRRAMGEPPGSVDPAQKTDLSKENPRRTAAVLEWWSDTRVLDDPCGK
jgi:predicted acylesterase/phospholipase RssA